MLVKFERVDRSPIWINPALVSAVKSSMGYRINELGTHVSYVVEGEARIILFEDMSVPVLGTPEEVVAKLFPQTQAQATKERLAAITESLKDEVQVNPQRTCLTCKWYEGAEVPWANCKFPLPSLPLVVTEQLVCHWTPDLAATNCPTWEAKDEFVSVESPHV
jgi:hypothetical protein